MIPEGIVTSVWPRVRARLADADILFDPWQDGLNMAALGCRADGKFAATVGGVAASIPRQTGKTRGVGGMLLGACLEIPGFQVAWTSHHNRTTTRTFQTIRALARRKHVYPLLDHTARSDGTRAANGEQEIRFKNGSVFMFGAREQGFGRGLDAIDAEVFDEAQILTLKALEDMVPAVNQARNPHGGLLFFLGTPPRPVDPGEAFAAKREQALSGQSRGILYAELSADPNSDPDDRSQWPVMNPSYPFRTPLESMLRMRANIPDDDAWNREARGIWPAVTRFRPAIDPAIWKQRFDAAPEGIRPDALGVDMSHRGEISVSACWAVGDGAHAEEVRASSDASAVVDWLTERVGRRTPVFIDGASPAASLIPDLRSRRVKVVQTTAGDMAKACGLVVNWTVSGRLTHGGQDSVTDALKGAQKRPIRDAGGWGWDRREGAVNVAPLVAWTLAVFGAANGARSGKAFFL